MLVVAAVALMGFGFVRGVTHEEKRFDAYKVAQDKAVLAEALKGAQKTSDLRAAGVALEGAKNDEIKAIGLRLSSALGELRNRPDRRANSTAAASTCSGASGAELAGGDAQFLERYAADAADQQSTLSYCIDLYAKARSALAQPH